MDLMLELLNFEHGTVPEKVPEKLKAILGKYTLGQSLLARAVVGKPLSFTLRDDAPNEYYFSQQDILLDKKASKELGELFGQPNHTNHYFCPRSPEFDKAINVILQELLNLRSFIGKAIDGSLDLDYINQCVFYAQKCGRVMFRPNGWTPTLEVVPEENPGMAKTFQDDLEQRVVLTPLFQGKAEEWSKIKICEQCGKFFFPQKSFAQFCSTPCRMRFNKMKKLK